MKIGDRVEIVAIPDPLPEGMETKQLFKRCLGREFVVVGVNALGWLELEAGEAVGQPAYMQSIWIEPHCVRLAD